jgi:hypothetical protein
LEDELQATVKLLGSRASLKVITSDTTSHFKKRQTCSRSFCPIRAYLKQVKVMHFYYFDTAVTTLLLLGVNCTREARV